MAQKRKLAAKLAAAACALLVVLSAAGCADTSWAVKVDDVTVPAGVYLTYLMGARSSVISKSESSSSSSSVNSANLLTTSSSANNATLSGTSSSTSSSDPWSQTIEGQNALSWAINQALESSESYAVINELCAKRSLKLTSSESSTVSQYAATYMQYGTYTANGVSQSSLEKVLGTSYYLSQKLFDSYYGKGGEYEVKDDDIKKYYTANFVHIKQIFVSKYDSSNALLTGDALQKAKDKANTAFAQAQADKSKFDSLVKTYNEDSGMTSNPDGYIFDKDADYLQVFKDTAFSMAVGDVKLIESDEGFHIMYKLTVDPSASTYSTNKESALQAMKSSDFQKLIKNAVSKAKIQKNDSTINKYSPKNLSDS